MNEWAKRYQALINDQHNISGLPDDWYNPPEFVSKPKKRIGWKVRFSRIFG